MSKVSEVLQEAHGALHGSAATLDDVISMIQRMDSRLVTGLGAIETQVKKIDKIEFSMTSLACKVTGLEREIKSVKQKAVDLETSAEAMSNFYDDMKTKTENCELKITHMDSELEEHRRYKVTIESEFQSLRAECNELHSVVEDLQCRSMKNNLVFTGLREQYNENTEDKVKEFIWNELGIQSNIEFGNVHRFKKRISGRNRPIVARFIYFADRQAVMERGYLLRGTQFGISEQFPATVEERRKPLYSVMKRYRSKGCSVKLVRDKMYVNGKLFNGSTEEFDEELGFQESQQTESRLNRGSYRDAVQAPLIDFTTPSNNRKPKRQRISSSPIEETSRPHNVWRANHKSGSSMAGPSPASAATSFRAQSLQASCAKQRPSINQAIVVEAEVYGPREANSDSNIPAQQLTKPHTSQSFSTSGVRPISDFQQPVNSSQRFLSNAGRSKQHEQLNPISVSSNVSFKPGQDIGSRVATPHHPY